MVDILSIFGEVHEFDGQDTVYPNGTVFSQPNSCFMHIDFRLKFIYGRLHAALDICIHNLSRVAYARGGLRRIPLSRGRAVSLSGPAPLPLTT